jgi:hypothetical protein
MCLIQVFADGSVCLAWGMLFMVVVEGRPWIVELGGLVCGGCVMI